MAGLYRGKVQNDCEINYMQGKKYPNSSEKVYPNNNVSNKGLLKNPYNTISEPIAKPGQRPVRITTDMWGNVYARSDTMLVPGVTNSNLLKNPFNNLSEPVPEKKVLSNQKIKDINNKNIPEFMRKNVGISDLAMKMLMMIRNKNVKLFTIRLMSYLVTKNLNDIQIDLGARGEQQILQAVNIYNQLMANAKRINVDYAGNEEQLTANLYPYVHSYVEQLIRAIPTLGAAELDDIDARITKALADLAVVSSALNRLFEQDKAPDPSSILSADDIVRLGGIQAASVPPVVAPAGGGGPPPANKGSARKKPSPSRGMAPPPKPPSLLAEFAKYIGTNDALRLLERRAFDYDNDRDKNLFNNFMNSKHIMQSSLIFQNFLSQMPTISAMFFSATPSFTQNPSTFNPIFDPTIPIYGPKLEQQPKGWQQQQFLQQPPQPLDPDEDEDPKDPFFMKWLNNQGSLSPDEITAKKEDRILGADDTRLLVRVLTSLRTYLFIGYNKLAGPNGDIPIVQQIQDDFDLVINRVGNLIRSINLGERQRVADIEAEVRRASFFFQDHPALTLAPDPTLAPNPNIAPMRPSAGRKKKQGGSGRGVKLLNQAKAGIYQSY